MHNENEKERFDDVFVIVTVFVLVRNLLINDKLMTMDCMTSFWGEMYKYM
jgi:hypothetical protein